MNCALLLNCNEMSIYYIRKLLNKRERERYIEKPLLYFRTVAKKSQMFSIPIHKTERYDKNCYKSQTKSTPIKCAHIDRRCLRTGPPRPLPSSHQVPGYMQLTLLSHFYVNQHLFCLENETHFMLRRGVHKLIFPVFFFLNCYIVYICFNSVRNYM